MNVAELTDAERLLIERARILAKQDDTFRHLPDVLADRFLVMVQRGARYNGNGTGVADQVGYMGDQSCFHRAYEPLNRAKQAIGSGRQHIPDNEIGDLIDDTGNFIDIWLCVRAAREEGDV